MKHCLGALVAGMVLLSGIVFAAEAAKAHRNLDYVVNGHDRHKLDVFVPETGTNWPLIVWIHGGAWLGGSKENCPAMRFVGEGYAVASINYRLSQHATFPAQLIDCKAAIRWLRSHSRQFGYNRSRIGVWGASAGGHLAALVGTSSDVQEFDGLGDARGLSSRVQCVVDFFGPSDLTLMGKQAPPDSALDHDAPDSPESKLIGGPIQERKEEAQKANSITYVSADDPPFLIVHGDADNVVPIGQSELLHAALTKAAVNSTYRVIKGAGHGFGQNAEVNAMVAEFFAKHLKR
jgi:acetyl esterase/lipase